MIPIPTSEGNRKVVFKQGGRIFAGLDVLINNPSESSQTNVPSRCVPLLVQRFVCASAPRADLGHLPYREGASRRNPTKPPRSTMLFVSEEALQVWGYWRRCVCLIVFLLIYGY